MIQNIHKTYNAYVLYQALKRHFTSLSYDFIKYNGKINCRIDSFAKRKDTFHYYKLACLIDPKHFLIANFMAGNIDVWLGDLLHESQYHDTYKKWVAKQQSISYVFQNDLNQLKDKFQENFTIHNGEYPFIVKLYQQKKINIETLIIFDDMFKLFLQWSKEIDDKIIFLDINNLVVKSKPFITYNKQNIKNILIERYKKI